MAQAIDEPFALMHGYLGTGIPYLMMGDGARAIPLLERDFALCRATDINLCWARSRPIWVWPTRARGGSTMRAPCSTVR
jgi:hypothetical protein